MCAKLATPTPYLSAEPSPPLSPHPSLPRKRESTAADAPRLQPQPFYQIMLTHQQHIHASPEVLPGRAHDRTKDRSPACCASGEDPLLRREPARIIRPDTLRGGNVS